MDVVSNIKNADREIYIDEEFYVFLTIDGTSIKNIKVKVSNPCIPLKEQVQRIMTVFNLPKLDNGGNPIQYLLGQIMEYGEEPEILEFEDEDGREQTLIDCNIHSGDSLCLVSVPLCGGIWCNIIVVKTIILFFRYQYLKVFKVSVENSRVCRLYGFTEHRIQELICYLKLNNKRQYYLAKINNEADGVKFFFLNGKNGDNKQYRSLFEYYNILKPQGSNNYPYLLLFPITGLTMRNIKKLQKIVPRYNDI